MQELIAHISLAAVLHNCAVIKKKSGAPLIAVVKDDAYGHGAEEIALALGHEAGAFAVATAQEGAALRCGGVSGDILVLTPPLDLEDAVRICAYGLIGSVTSLPSLRLFEEAGGICGLSPRVHIAVNTGMNRYGVRPERARAAAKRARDASLSVEGVFSHLFSPGDAAARREQETLFSAACAGVKEIFPSCISHLSSTGGIFEGGDSCDFVRAGLALYGYGGKGLKRAMKVYALSAHCCTQLGSGAGYARAERTFGALSTLRLGYGDGFFRTDSAHAIGNLCMDACIVAEKIPFGKRKLVLSDMEEYARTHGTSVYEVLVNVARRAQRVYV